LEGAALNRIVVVARSHLRRLASENSDIAGTVAVEILHPPCALKFEVGHQGEIARFEASQFFGHIHDTTLIVGRSSIARASRSFQGLARGTRSEGGDLCCRRACAPKMISTLKK